MRDPVLIDKVEGDGGRHVYTPTLRDKANISRIAS